MLLLSLQFVLHLSEIKVDPTKMKCLLKSGFREVNHPGAVLACHLGLSSDSQSSVQHLMLGPPSSVGGNTESLNCGK